MTEEQAAGAERWGERRFERDEWAALRAHESVPIQQLSNRHIAHLKMVAKSQQVTHRRLPMARPQC